MVNWELQHGIYNSDVPDTSELKQDGEFSSVLFTHPMAKDACMTQLKV
jgi:hypothetical protein